MLNRLLQLGMLWGVVASSSADKVILHIESKASSPNILQMSPSKFPCDTVVGTSFFIEAHDNFYVPKTNNPIIMCEEVHAGEY